MKTFNWKKIGKKIFCWTRNIFLALFTASLFFALLYKYVPVYQTGQIMAARTGNLFIQSARIQHQWVPLSEISQHLVQAVIASEDQLFLIHNGFNIAPQDFNPAELSRSRYPRPTETISQQTARMVFLLPGKNHLNNLLCNYFTVLIEFIWGKERILEVYLNSVEFAPGVYGAETIAKKNFQEHAGELTAAQAALITVAIPNPTEFDSLHPTVYMLRKQAKIISVMEQMIPVEYGKIEP
jgi:monofunctional biosynthetic peptidoglycan transglycosylase